MAKQANRMLIGGFVVIAVGILAASIVIFGSGKFFKSTEKYVLYFEGSIRGLDVGAPVLFQGVPIGSVSSIVIRAERSQMKTEIPVVIEVDPDNFQVVDDRKIQNGADETEKLIEMGLRAVLTLQSLITGKLLIELDFHPGTPVHFRNVREDYPEIPTIPSTTAKLGQALKKLDLEKMEAHLESILSGIDRLVNSPEMGEAVNKIKGAFEEIRQLIQKVEAKVDPLTDNLNRTVGDVGKLARDVDSQIEPLMENVSTTLFSYERLAREADTQVEALAASVDETLAEARTTLKQGNRTLSAVEGGLSENSPLIYQFEETLRDFSGAARSLRILAEYLKRHPEALLKGKGESSKSGGE
jgi:paraquat-inducible protein B